MIPGSLASTTIRKTRGGYTIDQSIRFDKTTSSHLSKTYGSAGNRRTWTFSTWFKRGKIDGTRQSLFAATGQAYLQIGPDAASREMITILNEGSGTDLNWYTTAVYRDPSAWYHLVWQFDSTQATADNRTKLYINGSQITDFTKAATPDLNLEGAINNAVEHKIGEIHIANYYFDGYQAEINFIDGTALDASSFGETNADGVWIPKAYTGSYGTNGFYITGETASDLGEDFSGNDNDFTSSGLTSADQVTGDTPTTNACVMSPIDQYGSTLNLADGNLRCTPSTSSYCSAHGTFYVSSGKWVIECKHTTVFGEGIGFGQNGQRISGSSHRGFGMFADGRKFVNTTYAATGTGLASGDYRYCFLDLDNNAMWFAHVDVSSSDALVYDNSATKAEIEAGTTTNAVHTSLPAGYYAPTVWMDTSGVIEMNFGQSAFYTSSDLPEGFNTLNTANLATPSITDGSAYFQPTLYEGNGSTQSINQTGNSTFQPDFAWIKNRDAADAHALFDAVRGATKVLSSNATTAEATNDDTLTGFESDGFALGDDVIVNTNSESYVAWQWKANGAGSSNTDGTVASTVSANPTAGFSIAKWTHTTASNYTVGHGLGAVPKMILVKTTDQGTNWGVYHSDITVGNRLILNSTSAQVAGYWGANSWTSSIFSIGSARDTNGSTMIAYCFAEIPGYSSIGSYTGNGSANGPFVYTGFKPAFIIFKNSNSGNNWDMMDTQRSPINPVDQDLQPSTASAESTPGNQVDYLSNGFKLRTASANINGSGNTIIYMAFAENPFGGDGVAPATAR